MRLKLPLFAMVRSVAAGGIREKASHQFVFLFQVSPKSCLSKRFLPGVDLPLKICRCVVLSEEHQSVIVSVINRKV